MATVVTATGCIPLMSKGPSPAAVNSAQAYRQGFVGALTTPAPNGPMTWLSGVLSRASTANVYSVDLQVVPLSTPGQGVQTWPGTAVISRGASNGPYLVMFNNTVTINLDAADATNPRIDVVYIQVNDDAIGDGGSTNGGFMAVVNGTPASTPTVPAVPAGAIPTAQIYRNTVANSGNVISSANITDVRNSAGTAGGIRLYLPGDSLAANGSYNGEYTYDSQTYGLRYWQSNAWHGAAPKIIPTGSLGQAQNAAMNTGGATYVLAQTNVPDPGYPYTLRVDAKCDFWNYSNTYSHPVRIRLDNSSTGTVVGAGGTGACTNWATSSVQGCLSGQLTGSHTVYFVYQPGTTNVPTCNFPDSYSVWCNVEVMPA